MSSKKSELEKVKTSLGTDQTDDKSGKDKKNKDTAEKGDHSDSDGPPDNVPV